MFKTVFSNVWAFDIEWVPDPESGRRVYDLPKEMPDTEVVKIMWEKNGATDDEPRPFLKTMLCRIVSLSVIKRHIHNGSVTIEIVSLPRLTNDGSHMDEAEILQQFLDHVGREKPQLVGFNSECSDMLILRQRAIAHGLSLPAFASRPQKPWEGVDYFDRYSDAHVDLIKIVGAFGARPPSLHQFATTCHIPGKMGTSGDDVYDLWCAGNTQKIVEYNEYDALTTYLCWLRVALFGGFVEPRAYIEEQAILRTLLEEKIADGQLHYQAFLDEWDRLAQR